MKPAPLTDAQIDLILYDQPGKLTEAWFVHFARAIEAAVNQQWQEMLAKQEPVLYVDPNTLEMAAAHVGAWKPGHELPHNIPLYRKPNDHTAVMRQALEALDCLEAPPTGAINHYELERRKNALRAALAQPDVPEGYVLVPVEPTEEMLAVARERGGHYGYDYEITAEWQAMLNAAPKGGV